MSEITELIELGILLYGAPVLGLAVMAGAFGLPVPSSLLLIIAGAFSRQGNLDWYYAAALGLLGAVVGDSLGFVLGRWGGKWASRRYGNSKLWVNAQSNFDRGSGVAVFLTRFLITALAVPVNLMAGSSKLRFRSFFFYMITGEAMWIILYGGLGYLFSSQWQYIHSTLSYFGSAALVLAATVFILYFFWRIKRYNFWTFRFQFARIPFKRLP
jgi:membrane protein DedA with SNARE-associated domain